VSKGVHLERVDDALAAEIRGLAPTTRAFAAGFPRSEDLDAVEARARGAAAFAIVADGVVVGTCGTHGAPRGDGVVELGWGLVESARGHRIGTSAVRHLLDATRTAFPAASMLARTQWSTREGTLGADSPASEAILVHLGFTPTQPPRVAGLRSWRLEGQSRAER
jgi:RimJ/RimL family protein N-acetyltransferase